MRTGTNVIAVDNDFVQNASNSRTGSNLSISNVVRASFAVAALSVTASTAVPEAKADSVSVEAKVLSKSPEYFDRRAPEARRQFALLLEKVTPQFSCVVREHVGAPLETLRPLNYKRFAPWHLDEAGYRSRQDVTDAVFDLLVADAKGKLFQIRTAVAPMEPKALAEVTAAYPPNELPGLFLSLVATIDHARLTASHGTTVVPLDGQGSAFLWVDGVDAGYSTRYVHGVEIQYARAQSALQHNNGGKLAVIEMVKAIPHMRQLQVVTAGDVPHDLDARGVLDRTSRAAACFAPG